MEKQREIELAQQRLEAFLLEGIESGATDLTRDDWTQMRAEAMRQFLEKRRAAALQ